VRALRRIRRGKPRGRILDVGCGDGILFPALIPFGEVEGIEADGTTLDPAGPWRDRIHVAPFDQSAPLDGQYDLILILDVIEHLDAPVAALRHALSLLRPDGALLVTVPALPALWTAHDDLNHHRRRYTRRQLSQELGEAGFEVESMRFLFHSLVIGKLAVRWREHRRGRRPALPRVPPPGLNRFAAGISKAEMVVLAPASRILPGTSLLAVGRPATR
ncbi:MAG: class I SAM-dependent methyltransferase, partial [Gemmatimonadales bacterium]